jgi:tripartite-type tricarboxylate transporter receptor subunit TctC
MRVRHLALAILVASGLAPAAFAQTYPERSIRFIVPAPTGGGTDISARVFGQKMSEYLGQQIIVENKPGASGNIGAQQVARSTPDGYTLLATFGGNITINPHLSSNLGFDPEKDLTPVAQFSSAPYFVVVNPSVPAKSVKELIALAKTQPGMMWASTAPGAPDHLAGELFRKMANIDIVNVPYKGGAEAVLDIIGGRIPIGFLTIPTTQSHVAAGKLLPLGVSGLTRSPLAPDVPTIHEAALPGYTVLTWFGLWAPAGTPAPIVEKLHAAVQKSFEDPEVKKRLNAIGLEAAPSGSPAEFGKFIAAELKQYGELIQSIGLVKK